MKIKIGQEVMFHKFEILHNNQWWRGYVKGIIPASPYKDIYRVIYGGGSSGDMSVFVISDDIYTMEDYKKKVQRNDKIKILLDEA